MVFSAGSVGGFVQLLKFKNAMAKILQLYYNL